MIRKILLKAFTWEAVGLTAAFDRLTREPARAQEKVLREVCIE